MTTLPGTGCISIFQFGCCLKPKAWRIGTPSHPFSTPWTSQVLISIHLHTYVSGVLCEEFWGMQFAVSAKVFLWWRNIFSKRFVFPIRVHKSFVCGMLGHDFLHRPCPAFGWWQKQTRYFEWTFANFMVFCSQDVNGSSSVRLLACNYLKKKPGFEWDRPIL